MRKKKIVACYGRRWEPQWLIDDLRKNLSWVDDFVEIDYSHLPDDHPWTDENELYRLQREGAKALNADWVLITAPDERWDNNAEKHIRERIAYLKRTILRFPVKDLYTPTSYRNDRGFWRHEESRVYPFWEGQTFDTKPFHNNIAPEPDRFSKRESIPVNIYNLKTIEPENRALRVAMYKASDPQAKMTVLKDYDYLLDESHMELRKIIPPEGYEPPYTRPYYFNPPEQLWKK